MNKSVGIICPTTGATEFLQCFSSVYDQSYDNVRPYFVVDGFDYYDPIQKIMIEKQSWDSFHFTYLAENVGSNGWYGHRTFAAWSYLVNTDYVIFLDQDNWLEPNHVESMVDTLESGDYDWVYSLRNIYTKNGDFFCKDNSESLGMWPGANGLNHVDSSCYLVKREVAVSVAGAWFGQYGQDRVYYNTLSTHYPKYKCTREFTLNYRVGGNEGSLNPSFIVNGNIEMKKRYGTEDYPWIKDVKIT